MPLDPITGLSVAASVIQVVDFSLRIVSKSKDLYNSNSGMLKENAETKTATVRLKQMTSRLQYPEELQGGTGEEEKGQDDTNEQTQHNRLRDICQECSEASDELLLRLGKLKVPRWSENRKWKSFRQALKSVWSKKAIDDLARRLGALRAELNSHILEILSEKFKALSIQQRTRFANLDYDTRKVIDSIARADITTKEYMRKGFESLRKSEKAEHMKTRAAFISLDGKKRRVQVDLALLESLRFPEMNHRSERVAEAHKETFTWAFRNPKSSEKPWDNFVEWLSKGNGIYWIQGKAASGKSTLMRFIQQNDLTRRNLELWSGHSELVAAAFFFWNSGVPEERSQRGLLRSLLFNLLQNRRTLISQIFPDEWENKSELAAHDLAIGTINWSLAQLKKAFARLIACASQKLKMCFFVDGLDEYEGDPGEITQYFKDISMVSEHAKFCLSSRPWPIFQDIFQDAPGLRLQDMTYDDIRLYVEDNLERNRNMQVLLDDDPRGSSELIGELVNKADGVFLWVVLVVKSLITGLRNGDTIVHLSRKLKAIPSDIEDLYDHMLKSIHPLDLEEASQIFQIFRKSGNDLGLATLQRALHALQHFDYQTVISMEFETVQTSDSDFTKGVANLKRMNARLNSRCKGLLETFTDDPISALNTKMSSNDSDRQNSNESNSRNKRKRGLDEPHVKEPSPLKLKQSEEVHEGIYHSGNSISNVPHMNSSTFRNAINGKLSPCTSSFEFSEVTGADATLLTSKIVYLHRTFRDYLEQEKVWESLPGITRLTSFDPCAALLMVYIMELKTATSKGAGTARPISIAMDNMNIPSSEPHISLKTELERVLNIHWWGDEMIATAWSLNCQDTHFDSTWLELESEFQTIC